MFGLHEIARTTSIEIFITLDGAELCDHLNHLTAGVKMVYKRGVDPKTGWPLFTFTEELLGSAFACQSRNFCFILKSLIGRDTKDAYDAFSDFLNSLTWLRILAFQRVNMVLGFYRCMFGAPKTCPVC
jgi:hypothetical protein